MILLILKKKQNKDFDNKFKNSNKKVTLNKIKHGQVKKKLGDLSKKVKLISTEVLTKDLMNIVWLMMQNILIAKLSSIYIN